MPFKRKPKDIQLPNESGRVDPRLRKPDVFGAVKRAAEGAKIIMDRNKKK